jgi:uncharacterized membrane protein SirB2
MALIDHYLAIKHAHMTLAATSVALFVLRGGGVLAGARWPMVAAVRRLSIVIDTLLIAAGSTLWWMLSLHPAREQWLAAKLALIVLYIVLGSLALRRAPTRLAKALAFAASLACIGTVAAVALAHDAAVIGRLLGLQVLDKLQP